MGSGMGAGMAMSLVPRKDNKGGDSSTSSRYWRAGSGGAEQASGDLWVGSVGGQGPAGSGGGGGGGGKASTTYASRLHTLSASRQRPRQIGKSTEQFPMASSVPRGQGQGQGQGQGPPASASGMRNQHSGGGGAYSNVNSSNSNSNSNSNGSNGNGNGSNSNGSNNNVNNNSNNNVNSNVIAITAGGNMSTKEVAPAVADPFMLQRPPSGAMPVFSLPNATPQTSNQRDEDGAGRPIRGGGNYPRGGTPIPSGQRSLPGKLLMPRSESYTNGGGDDQRTAFSGYSGGRKNSIPSSDTGSGIEIFEPSQGRVRPSSASQFSVSPITIRQMEVDDASLRNVRGDSLKPQGSNLWGLAVPSPPGGEGDTLAGSRPDGGGGLPELGASGSAPGARLGMHGLLGAKVPVVRNNSSSNVYKGNESKTEAPGLNGNGNGNSNSNGSMNANANGLFQLRGSTAFLPVSAFASASNGQATGPRVCVEDMLAEGSPRSSETHSPPPYVKFGMNSPLTTGKIQKITNKTECAEKVKPILKKHNHKSSNGTKKSVKIVLSENMYCDHVPYVSPPKGSTAPIIRKDYYSDEPPAVAGRPAPLISTASPTNYNSYGAFLGGNGGGGSGSGGGGEATTTELKDGGNSPAPVFRHRDSLKFNSNNSLRPAYNS
jgi:hypothetical protein